MMGREIKFRSWDKVFGRMIDDVYLCRNSVEFGGRGFDAMKDHYIPMQYTGLKDRNGREIYEGDIVSESPSEGPSSELFEVLFEAGVFRMQNEQRVKDLRHMRESAVVIGNICENRDFIKEVSWMKDIL